MVAPVRARPAPRPATRPATRPEPRRLQLVSDARLRDAARRRRMRLVAVAAGFVVVASLFGLAAGSAMLVSGQDRLDRLQQRVAQAQSQYSTNRLKVAELEAPDHIVKVAQERLGMVPPPGVTYLTPSQALADQVSGAQSRPDTPRRSNGGTSWAAVKPYLAGQP